MDIVAVLDLGLLRLGKSKQIVREHLFVGHHFRSERVVVDDIVKLARRVEFTLGNGRRRAPDQRRAGLFHACDELSQVDLVVGGHDLLLPLNQLEVMQAPVEVDHIPLAGPQPGVDVLDPVRRRSAVGRDAVDIGLALQDLAHRQGVADRNRITDQQDSRQLRIVLDLRQRRVGGDLRLGLGFGLGFVSRLLREEVANGEQQERGNDSQDGAGHDESRRKFWTRGE